MVRFMACFHTAILLLQWKNKLNLTDRCQIFLVGVKRYLSKYGYLRINTDILFVWIGYVFVYHNRVLNPFLAGVRDAQANIPNSGIFHKVYPWGNAQRVRARAGCWCSYWPWNCSSWCCVSCATKYTAPIGAVFALWLTFSFLKKSTASR